MCHYFIGMVVLSRRTMLRLSLSRPRWQSCRRTIFQKGKKWCMTCDVDVCLINVQTITCPRPLLALLFIVYCVLLLLFNPPSVQFSSVQFSLSLSEQLLKRNWVHVCVYAAGWSLLVSVRLHYRVDCRDCASSVVNLLHAGLKKKGRKKSSGKWTGNECASINK